MRLLPALLICTALCALSARPAWTGPTAARKPASDPMASERKAQALDAGGLWAKKKAAKALMELIQKYKGQRQEAELLIRLADLYHEIAAIEYRVAYSQVRGQAPNLAAYKAALKESLIPLNKLIKTFQNSQVMARAYYLRGKAQADLGQKDVTVADFKRLIATWPQAPEAPLAYSGLWDLLMERADYRGLIASVQKRGLNRTDKLYGTALERLSWAYYYLNDLPSALRHAGAQVAHYNSLKGTRQDRALEREKAMSNVALFYATGVSKRTPGMTTAGAPAQFKKLFTGEDFTAALIQYAYVLRTKGLDSDIEQLKVIAQGEDYEDDFKAEMLLIAIENELNRRQWKQYSASVGQLSYLTIKSSSLKKGAKIHTKAYTVLTEALTPLQATFTTQKDPASAVPVAGALMQTYRFVLDSAPDVDAAVKIRFNMAELSLRVKNYPNAVMHYRWIVSQGQRAGGDQVKLWREANLKSIASQYELLKQKGVMPKELAAKPLGTEARELPQEATQWIAWLDAYREHSEGMDDFRFEASRLIYSYGRVKEALARLGAFALAQPASKLAIPAAALVLDTYIASEAWEEARRTADSYLGVSAWRGTPFAARLTEVSADTSYKLVEASYKKKEYPAVIAGVEKFLASPLGSASRRRPDFLEIAANAALAQSDRKTALKYFGGLRNQGTSKPDAVAAGVLTSASLSEDSLDFETASADYLRYLTLMSGKKGADPKTLESARAKALLFGWLSGNPRVFAAAVMSNHGCGGRQSPECDDYRLRAELAKPDQELDTQKLRDAARRALKPSEKNRAACGMLALRKPELFALSEQLSLVEATAAEWGKLDPLLAYSASKPLFTSVPAIFARASVSTKTARVGLDKNLIGRRTQLVGGTEERLTKASALPWIGTRVAGLREISVIYREFSRELAALPPPAGLAGEDLASYRKTIDEIRAPFSEKAELIRRQALELAAKTGADGAVMRGLVKGVASVQVAPLIGLELLERGPEDPLPAAPAAELLAKFNQALSSANFPKAGFLIQEGRRRELFPEPFLSLMEAVSLAKIGAVPEALAAVAPLRDKANELLKQRITLALAAGYYQAGTRKTTEDLLDELPSKVKEDRHHAWIAHASRWVDQPEEEIREPAREKETSE